MEDKKRSNDYLGISEKRIEELKRITSDMMHSNTLRVDNNLRVGNNLAVLDVVNLLITLEDRDDITVREKILCSFQMGMNAQRLLKKEQYQ